MQSREIKFRGMLINGGWVYGLLAYTEHRRIACGDTGYFISNKVGLPFAYHVIPETIGQYTGLKDKNGVEIYEGDILEYKTNKKQYSEVKFIDDGFKIRRFSTTTTTVTSNLKYFLEKFKCEVVGNIKILSYSGNKIFL